MRRRRNDGAAGRVFALTASILFAIVYYASQAIAVAFGFVLAIFDAALALVNAIAISTWNFVVVNNESVIAAGTLLLLILLTIKASRFYARAAEKKRLDIEKEADTQLALAVIFKHREALNNKKKKCLKVDAYGIESLIGWEKEVAYFRKNVLEKTLGDKAYIVQLFDYEAAIELAISTMNGDSEQTVNNLVNNASLKISCS